MTAALTSRMEDAWAYIWNGLYCEQTKLFYDYRTGCSPENRFAHLPRLEEIALQFPNPCGWGTGMEDSMLNAGSVMDILRLRKNLTGDPSALTLAGQVLEGMIRCTRIHGREGFVARSVSPHDGRSCYFNSSRDQFTLCVYGLWRFLQAFADAPVALRTEATQLLLDIARYCEQTVHADNDDLRRLDGKGALVSTMVHVQAHEILRLPMIYAAAWDASREGKWLALYRHYAGAGMQNALALDHTRQWNDWELVQMQLSLALLSAVEPERDWLAQYQDAMRQTAELAEQRLERELAAAEEFPGSWDLLNDDWRRMPFLIRPETLKNGAAIYEGYPYLLPQFPKAFYQPYAFLRAIGNLVCALALHASYKPQTLWRESFARIAARPDYRKHGSDGPINLLHGYWLGRGRSFW